MSIKSLEDVANAINGLIGAVEEQTEAIEELQVETTKGEAGWLKFKLPEQADEFLVAQRGMLYLATLWDLDQWARGLEKYQDKETVTIDELRGKIRELMRERNISLEDYV